MKSYPSADAAITYDSVNEKDAFYLISLARQGLGYPLFNKLAEAFAFTMHEWAGFLHISERTMQRYQKEGRAFDPVSSERIIEITLFYKQAIEVFGSREKANAWMGTEQVALGGARPKELLDSSMGIRLLQSELVRIAHGIL